MDTEGVGERESGDAWTEMGNIQVDRGPHVGAGDYGTETVYFQVGRLYCTGVGACEMVVLGA